jgi:acetyl-CoA carboxylase alpha subunit
MSPSDQLAMAEEIERQIAELETASDSDATREEIERLRLQVEALRRHITAKPNDDAWSRVLMARQPQRP